MDHQNCLCLLYVFFINVTNVFIIKWYIHRHNNRIFVCNHYHYYCHCHCVLFICDLIFFYLETCASGILYLLTWMGWIFIILWIIFGCRLLLFSNEFCLIWLIWCDVMWCLCNTYSFNYYLGCNFFYCCYLQEKWFDTIDSFFCFQRDYTQKFFLFSFREFFFLCLFVCLFMRSSSSQWWCIIILKSNIYPFFRKKNFLTCLAFILAWWCLFAHTHTHILCLPKTILIN